MQLQGARTAPANCEVYDRTLFISTVGSAGTFWKCMISEHQH